MFEYRESMDESMNEGGDRYNVVDNHGRVVKIDLAKPYADDIAKKHRGWTVQSAKSPKDVNEANTPAAIPRDILFGESGSLLILYLTYSNLRLQPPFGQRKCHNHNNHVFDVLRLNTFENSSVSY